MQPKHFESLYPENTREEEIARIVSYVREGNSCQLIGVPGVGRSNILGLLTYNREIRLKHFPTTHVYIHFVKIDFSEIRQRPYTDVIKLLFLTLSQSLRERGMDEEYTLVNELLREALALNDELVLTQGLKRAVEYLSIEKKLTIIFLFDRFEEYIPFVTSELFTTLRLFRNIAKYRFSVVFSVQRPLDDLLDPSLLVDFYEFLVGHTVYVRLYDEVGMTFRISYLEKITGKSISEKIKKEIVQLTGGHGKLVRIACESILLEEKEHTKTSLKDFLLANSKMRTGLLEIWKGLTPNEQEFLDTLMEDEVARVSLEKVGLFSQNVLAIPLLSTYITDSKRIQSTEKAPFVYEEATKVIRKGEMVISDSLTKAEFRLLRYLLLYPDSIVDREDVISVVWQEGATTAGVTDQAVDQLIFRVRRKIEDDPNHPEHLVTVKGRGFRFIP